MFHRQRGAARTQLRAGQRGRHELSWTRAARVGPSFLATKILLVAEPKPYGKELCRLATPAGLPLGVPNFTAIREIIALER